MRVDPDMLVKPDADDFVRLNVLEKNIRKYEPGFDFNPVRAAYDLVKPDRKALKLKRDVSTLVDHFTYDPLLLPERIVKDTKASSVDILAALLYPWVRPPNNRTLPDQNKMELIKGEFGREVYAAVQDTLSLRAVKYVEPNWDPALDKDIVKKTREEHLRQIKLMGLEIVRGTTPILLLGKVANINQERDIKYRETKGALFRPQKTSATATIGEILLAPLAYIAGYEEMRDQILDMAYKLRDPEGYRKTKEEIGRVANSRQIKQAKQGLIKEFQERFGWVEGDHYTIEIRPKPAYSARSKADRKEQPVSQLGDLCGARIIMNKRVIEGADKLNWSTLTKPKRNKLYQALGLQIHLIYKNFAKEMGRGSRKNTHWRPVIDPATGKQLIDSKTGPVFERYSPRRERFAELALQEPREKDPGRYDDDPGREAWEKKKYPGILDARFDDYVDRPKASGYSAYQDTLMVPRVYDEGDSKGEYVLDQYGNQLLVELECQFVDEIRHDYNMTGRRAGRVYFKTGLAKYTGEVMEWSRRARAKVTESSKKQARVRVIDEETNQVVDVTKNPTVAGFFAATHRECFCPEAKIYDGVEHANDNNVYGHDMPLKSGYRVRALMPQCG